MDQPTTTDPASAAPHRDVLNELALRAEDAAAAATPGAWRKLALLAAVAGIIFVVLYVASFLLLSSTPLGSASDQEILDYYADGTNLTLTLAAMGLMPFAGIAFIWFMVALRAVGGSTGKRVSRVVGHVQQATGIIFVALLFVATAALVATPAAIQFADAETDPIVARILPLLSSAILLMFGMRMAAMFVFTTSSIGLATGLLPRWFALAGYLVGLLLLLAFTFATWFVLLFAAWVLALCLLILWRYFKAAPAA